METLFWVPQKSGETGSNEYSGRIAGYGRNNSITPVTAIPVARVKHERVDNDWGPDAIESVKEHLGIKGLCPAPGHSYQSSKPTVNLKSPMIRVERDAAAERNSLRYF
jgi:hypothetical protein